MGRWIALAYDIGPRLGIDGEAEFRKAINAVNTTIRTLGTEMAAVTSAYDKNDRSAEALTSRNEVLVKQVDAQKEKLEKLKEGLAASAEKYGENDEKTQKWQQAVNRATAELNGLERELSGNRQALEQMARQQAQAEDATGQLTAKISAQESELGDLQRQYSNAVLEYGKNSQQAQELAGRIGELSGELEENREKLKDASDSTGEMDEAMDEAAEGADKFSDRISVTAVAIGNLVSSGIQAALGALKDMAGALLNLDETTAEYREAQGKLNTAFEAAGHSSEAARQAYTGFYRILGDTDTAAEASQLLAQLAENEAEMARWTGIAAGVAGTFGDALPINGLIEAANETVKVGTVTGALADALNWVGISEDAFNEQLAECGTEAQRNQLIIETLSGAYNGAAEAFLANNEAVIQAREGQAALDEAMAGLGETVSSVKSGLQAEFLPSIASLAEAFSGVVAGADGADEAFSAALREMSSTALEELPSLLAVGGQIMGGLTGTILGSLPELTDAALEIVTTLAGGVSDSLPELVPAAVDAVLQLVETLTEPDSLDSVIDAALEIIVSLAEGLVRALPELAERVPQIIANIVTTLAGELPKITESALQIVVTLALGLIAAIPELVKSIPQLVTSIVDSFSSAASDFSDIGNRIVEGVWEGIQAMGSWIKQKVSDFFGGIVDTVKGLLGIQSPSRVFREEVGQYIALGVAEGISDKSDKAVKAADALAKDVYKRSKDWADKQTKYMDLSYDEQIELWETIQSQFISTSKQYSDAQEKIFDLRQKKLEAAVKAEKDIMSELEDWTGDMEHMLFLDGKNGLETLEDTVAAYRAMQERVHAAAEQYRELGYAENSAEIQKLQKLWWSYEDSITERQQEALDEREAAQRQFASNVEAIQKGMQDVQNEYLEKLSQRTEEIYSAYGLFDKAPERQEVDGQELIDNLAGQIGSIRGFYSNLDELERRGVSEALVDEIRKMGVGAADQLEALLSLTDGQLSQYAALYGQKQRLANDIAERELADLKTRTEEQLMESLNEMGALFNDQGPEMGRAFTTGIISGIQEGVSGVESAVLSMANAAVDACKRELGIASPSKVFAQLGGYMADGLGLGFEEDMGAVQRRLERSMADLAEGAGNVQHQEAAPVTQSIAGGYGPISIQDMAEAFRLAMTDLRVDMNHREVGRIVSEWQNNEARSMGL